MTNLSILRIKGSSRLRITDEVVDNIAVAISYNTKLQLFNSRKIFSTRGVKRIVKALQGISTLTKLYISNNNITDYAADDI